MKSGNTELVQYGIHEEEVDLRIHVGFKVKEIYVYDRKKAIEVLQHHAERSAYQYVDGVRIETARGRLVPAEWHMFPIDGLRAIEIPKHIFARYKCNDNDDESAKGRKALGVVQAMLQEGRIQLYMPEYFKVSAKPENDLDMQIKGKDIVLIQDFPSIQVKCDYYAGNKGKGGTGNLFIQTHECNPLGKY